MKKVKTKKTANYKKKAKKRLGALENRDLQIKRLKQKVRELTDSNKLMAMSLAEFEAVKNKKEAKTEIPSAEIPSAEIPAEIPAEIQVEMEVNEEKPETT